MTIRHVLITIDAADMDAANSALHRGGLSGDPVNPDNRVFSTASAFVARADSDTATARRLWIGCHGSEATSVASVLTRAGVAFTADDGDLSRPEWDDTALDSRDWKRRRNTEAPLIEKERP